MRVLEPDRISRSYRQTLNATPERVFPLLCPVREAEWIADWDPLVVYSRSGVAEAGCVFVTRDGDDESVWVVTAFEPCRRVEMVKTTPALTVCHVAIELTAAPGGRTHADVTYTHTALGPRGQQLVEDFTEEAYRSFMERWESDLDAHLARDRPEPAR